MVSSDGPGHLIRGQVFSPGLSAESPDPYLELRGLNFKLPFFFSSSPSSPEPSSETPEEGYLAFETLQANGLTAGPLLLPLRSSRNHFEILGEPAFSWLEGRLTIRDIRLGPPLKPLDLSAGLTIQDIPLDRLLSGRRIPGRVDGHFDQVRVTSDLATFQGGLKADLFEGSVMAENLRVSRPWSADRRISGDLVFRHINLEPLTGLFSFGKITGFIQGEALGLTLAFRQLEGFDLRLRTEEVPGVSKKIAIRAIENISLLGTGDGELDLLSRGINRWIQEYDYEAIGISCNLKDDRLRIRGTILEEGEEYLVRKPGLFGLDVINKNPDNEMAFSDMMERLNRLRKTPSPGGNDEHKKD
jgi:hypothetical protein